MGLTKDQILGSKPTVEGLSVPQWGGDIFIRRLSVAAADKIQALSSGRSMIDLVLLSVVDADGQPMFSEDDRGFLEQQDVKLIGEIVGAINKVNGFTEDHEKNLEPSPSASSVSN